MSDEYGEIGTDGDTGRLDRDGVLCEDNNSLPSAVYVQERSSELHCTVVPLPVTIVYARVLQQNISEVRRCT